MNFGRHRTSRLTAADRRGWSVVPRTRLYRRGIAGAAAAMLVSVALLAQTSVTSEATWNDAEWVNGSTIGSASCEDPEGAFATRGEGRALSGSLLGIDLDNVAEAEGVTVTNDGVRDRATAGQPVSGLESAYADPLSVNALSAIQLPLTGLLELPTDNSTGVVGQFGQARDDGLAYGSGGYVTDSGGIDLADDQTGTYPDLATLKLSDLLDSPLLGDIGLGNTLSGVSDLELEVGAVAAQASLDGCESAWGGSGGQEARTMAAAAAEDIIEGLDRRYLTASADLTFRSDAVGSLVSGLNGTLTGLQSQINALIGQQSVTTSLVNAVTALLSGVLGTLRLGAIEVKHLSATIDISPVQELLSSPFGDAGGILTISPSDGTVRIDTAALLAPAYGSADGETLNGLAPNTNLLDDPAVLTTLTSALSSALEEWIGSIQDTLRAQINAISVSAEVSIAVRLLILPVAEITATVNGSLGDLLAGSVRASTNVTLLGSLDLNLLNPLLSALVNGLGASVGGILDPLFTGLRTLPSAVTGLVNPVITTVSRLYSGLFLSNILSLTVNAQNAPASGSPPPPDWRPGQPGAPPEGQYEVAALRIGVLDGLGPSGVRLYLGRASVGPGCSTTAARQEGSACAGY